eukprot:m.40625 g.40625  ORF g.40625 m.40625 type:complete len:337 (-) comp9687_c0_seq1:82-1092(-)
MQAASESGGAKPAIIPTSVLKAHDMTEEEFGTPSRIPTEPQPFSLDLDQLGLASKKEGSKAKLRNQSLYIKFDPLVGSSPSPPASPPKNKELPITMAEDLGNSNISSKVPTLQSNDGKQAIYTEEQKNDLIAEAMAQAEEEAMIVQMETEELRKKLAAEHEQNLQLTAVMEEYSSEITRLMAAKSKEGEADLEKMKAVEDERDQIQQDLEKTETAFADLHAKYTKVKEVVENYKANEKILKDALTKSQEAHLTSEDRYDKLRVHAEEKILEANKEIAAVREQYESQITALKMKVKTGEREVSSLKRQCETKDTDNEELTNICDELVKKLEAMGHSA